MQFFYQKPANFFPRLLSIGWSIYVIIGFGLPYVCGNNDTNLHLIGQCDVVLNALKAYYFFNNYFWLANILGS